MNLIEFVRESNRIEGIMRAPTRREVEATEEFLALPVLTIDEVCRLVAVYAPGHRLRDQEGLNVRVGNYTAPPGGPAIRNALHEFLDSVNRRCRSAWEEHVAYERLHPLTDGNGRSGRAIWLWQMQDAPLGFLHHFYYQTLATDPARAA